MCKGYHVEIELKIRAFLYQVLRLDNNSTSHMLVRLHLNSEVESSLMPLKPRCHFFSPSAMNHNFS